MLFKISKAGYGSIVLAGLMDAAVVIGSFVLLLSVVPESTIARVSSFIDPNLLILLWFIVYRLIAIVLFSRTPGMKFLKLIFLNSEEKDLNLKEKTRATFFILYRGVDYFRIN